mgnify:FL=1
MRVEIYAVQDDDFAALGGGNEAKRRRKLRNNIPIRGGGGRGCCRSVGGDINIFVDGDSTVVVVVWPTSPAWRSVRHLDTSHLSAHEGTNHGLKSHSAGVKGTMDMDTSAKTLNLQTKMRAADIEEIIFHEAN